MHPLSNLHCSSVFTHQAPQRRPNIAITTLLFFATISSVRGFGYSYINLTSDERFSVLLELPNGMGDSVHANVDRYVTDRNFEADSDYRLLLNRVSKCRNLELEKDTVELAIDAVINEVFSHEPEDVNFLEFTKELDELYKQASQECGRSFEFSDEAECNYTHISKANKSRLRFLSKAAETKKFFTSHIRAIKDVEDKYSKLQCRTLRRFVKKS